LRTALDEGPPTVLTGTVAIRRMWFGAACGRSPRKGTCSQADCAKLMQRMTREAKAAPPKMSEVQRKEVSRLFLALSTLKHGIALGIMHELITRSVPNG
jgi:hypothetical protein